MELILQGSPLLIIKAVRQFLPSNSCLFVFFQLPSTFKSCSVNCSKRAITGNVSGPFGWIFAVSAADPRMLKVVLSYHSVELGLYFSSYD